MLNLLKTLVTFLFYTTTRHDMKYTNIFKNHRHELNSDLLFHQFSLCNQRLSARSSQRSAPEQLPCC